MISNIRGGHPWFCLMFQGGRGLGDAGNTSPEPSFTSDREVRQARPRAQPTAPPTMPLAAPRSAPAKLPRVLGDDEVPVSKKHWDEMQDKLYEQGKRPKKLARLTEASKKAGSEMEGYKQAVKNKNDEVNIMVVKLKQAVIAHEKLLHDQDLLSMDYKNATVELAKRAQEYNAVCPERARLGRDLGTEAPPPEQTSAMDSVRVLSDQLEASLRSVLADPISTSAMAADGVLAERPGLAEDHHSAGGTSVMTPRPVKYFPREPSLRLQRSSLCC